MAIFKNTPPIVTSGLVLSLDAANSKSYVSGSTVWRDMSGNNNSGSLTNGPTFDPTNGGSIVFDGINDSVALNGTATTTTFTINTWIYPLSGSDPYGTILSYINTTGIWYRGVTKKITFFYSNLDHLTNGTLTENAWNNVVVVNNAGSASFYINSILDTATYTGTPSFTMTNIGDDPLSESYKGKISIMQVYNRALSAAEVKQNYDALKTRFNLS